LPFRIFPNYVSRSRLFLRIVCLSKSIGWREGRAVGGVLGFSVLWCVFWLDHKRQSAGLAPFIDSPSTKGGRRAPNEVLEGKIALYAVYHIIDRTQVARRQAGTVFHDVLDVTGQLSNHI